MGDVGSVRAAGRVGCAIRVENKAGISSGDKRELIRKRKLENKVRRSNLAKTNLSGRIA
jgi:hypothetical protein